MSFYGQFDQEAAVEAEVQPEAQAEAAADAEADAAMEAQVGAQAEGEESESSSEEVATGVLERDMARHEAPAVETGPGGKVLDLGHVEGLSAAASTLDHQAWPDEIVEKHESGTMKDAG
jgi:hypothetical protein